MEQLADFGGRPEGREGGLRHLGSTEQRPHTQLVAGGSHGVGTVGAKPKSFGGVGGYERSLVVNGYYRVERRHTVECHDRIRGTLGIVEANL
jgi:hypothetical protein